MGDTTDGLSAEQCAISQVSLVHTELQAGDGGGPAEREGQMAPGSLDAGGGGALCGSGQRQPGVPPAFVDCQQGT